MIKDHFKKHLTVTISDYNGTRQFRLNLFFKKFFLSFLIIFLTAFTLSVFLVIWFNGQLASLNVAKAEETKKFEGVLNKYENDNKLLKEINQDLERNLTTKSLQLSSVNDILGDMEKIIGTSNLDEPTTLNTRDSQEFSLTKKAEALKLNITEKKFLLELIPSGSPVPTNKVSISSRYGSRKHPIHKRNELHKGVDFRGNASIPLLATADGVVNYAQFNYGGFGNLVRIRHGFGFSTLYAHMSKIKVKYGKVVKKGDILGYIGNTGRSTGYHTHYEVHYLGKAINNNSIIRWNLQSYDKVFSQVKKSTSRAVAWDDISNMVHLYVNSLKKIFDKEREENNDAGNILNFIDGGGLISADKEVLPNYDEDQAEALTNFIFAK